jgi:hypothetical protein
MRISGPALGARFLAVTAAVALSACTALVPGHRPDAPDAIPDDVLEHPSDARGQLRPMPARPLDVVADCRFRDEAGYTTLLVLDIAQSQVKAFSAAVDVPRRGSCRFDGPFTQTRSTPSVQLRATDGCTANIWEQGRQVTVGFSNCARRCTRGTFDYVWPIIFDRSNGQCH